MTTKDQERKALEQIRKIVEGLEKDSYIGIAFEGCLDDAEANIENDLALSMYGRWQDAEQKIEQYKAFLKAAPERRKAHWIQNTTYPMIGSDAVVAEAYCSECELYSSQINAFGYVTYDICPRCGAEMEKGEDDV